MVYSLSALVAAEETHRGLLMGPSEETEDSRAQEEEEEVRLRLAMEEQAALAGQEWQLSQLTFNYGRTICYFECRGRLA
jgi:hypothetical protein